MIEQTLEWYRGMVPAWLAATPRVRRTLVLVTHDWLTRRVLRPLVAEPAGPLPADRALDGLAATLRLRVPPGEGARWGPWIGLVRQDLTRALAWGPAQRSPGWLRWLFLIPYAAPLPSVPSLRDAGASGSRSANVLPMPGALSTVTRPPWAATIDAVMASPSPAPRGSRSRAGSRRTKG